MSLQYDQPDSAESVTESLQENPSISAASFGAISQILNLETTTAQIVVGSWDGSGTVQAPVGQTPEMVVVDINQPSGTTVPVSIPTELVLNKVWIFDTDANIQVTFNTTERVIVMGNGNDEVTVIGDRNTTLDGGDGNDILILSGGADSVTGGNGNDSISAGAGNDTIVSGLGFDTVDGGAGFDVVQVASAVNQWTVVVDGAKVMLSGLPGTNNSVEMTNVDFISFGAALGNQNSIVITTAANNKDDAMRLYEAALDRSADQGGAQYWLDGLTAGSVNYVEVAGYFLGSSEYVGKYGTQTNTQFVQQIYQNAFDRSAEEAGLGFWVSALEGGASRAEVLAAIAGSTEAETTITNVVVVNSII